jgi:hypothetical protein
MSRKTTQKFKQGGIKISCRKGNVMSQIEDRESASLAEMFKEFIDNLPEDSDATIDDFYDHVGIDEDDRSDFATAAILSQYLKLIDAEDEEGEELEDEDDDWEEEKG